MKAHGLSSAICEVADGTLASMNGFVAKWASKENQCALKAGDDSNMNLPPPSKPPKEWPEAGPSTEDERWKTIHPSFRLSSRGRVQHKTNGKWGLVRTPVPNKGCEYATIKIDGRKKRVHVLVWETFCGPVPSGHVVDHKIPTRKTDNRLCHLQCISVSMQNTKEKKNYRSLSSRSVSTRIAIEGKPLGTDVWEPFESQQEAARILTRRFPGTTFRQGNIQSGIHTGRVRYGWVFRLAPV
jgi:hypothetical protein